MNSSELADKIFEEMSKAGASNKFSDIVQGMENVKKLLENSLKNEYQKGWKACEEKFKQEKTKKQINQN